MHTAETLKNRKNKNKQTNARMHREQDMTGYNNIRLQTGKKLLLRYVSLKYRKNNSTQNFTLIKILTFLQSTRNFKKDH